VPRLTEAQRIQKEQEEQARIVRIKAEGES